MQIEVDVIVDDMNKDCYYVTRVTDTFLLQVGARMRKDAILDFCRREGARLTIYASRDNRVTWNL